MAFLYNKNVKKRWHRNCIGNLTLFGKATCNINMPALLGWMDGAQGGKFMISSSVFTHENKHSGFRYIEPISGDYRVFLNGKEIPVYTCRISKYPFNRLWPGHQREIEGELNSVGKRGQSGWQPRKRSWRRTDGTRVPRDTWNPVGSRGDHPPSLKTIGDR